MPDIVDALRQMVNADSGSFFWAGEDHDISAVYAQKEEVYASYPAYAALRANGHLRRLHGDFSDWMRGERQFRNSAHLEPAFADSAFYWEVMRPCRCRHVIVSVVHDGRRGWGAVMLTRGPGRPAFSDTEQALLDSFRSHLMHALRPPQQVAGEYVDSEQGAAMLVDRQGRLQQCSPLAQRLLRFAQDDTLPARGPASLLPLPLQPLLERLRRIGSGAPAAEARIDISNRWGRFVWRGYPVIAPADGDASQFMLHVHHQQARQIVVARGAHELGLSAQQQIVGLRLAHGMTQRDIARSLSVKESTVIDHVRRIYERLEVRDSGALASRLAAAGMQVGAL
ncbi:helix-turn-helix transcriptional regulator [Uliginosibacterium sp. H1]|uniref:helix-turn-helix transcriptional regulator n=1 Tax=Uliginosibacterium sp. H1 TaxID=3114757 RepID=UPI002E191D1D|nr:helix-turn-helix transcriptional regulator [Uliginosibacterium sp. H1]